ncbi:hypothetical protein C5C24_11840 [Rathayibacter sp. AY2B3]|nr:hypothetical protein C5C24_11840 [Rathayibacter sp. AY2B3]PPG88958.1 hypothetical protein C5C39_12555 [Rathayibacter sp. AY1F3]PPH06864.1 hypothetical protein C5C71_15625 [Rathayibacter sp. AY1C1]PPH51103.1 hypothetical protein C5C67_12220 [Rathayibacter sp. AY1E1]PPI27990.1 hypothetical protein C5D66_14900 [Rathayibacter sp. AY1B4]
MGAVAVRLIIAKMLVPKQLLSPLVTSQLVELLRIQMEKASPACVARRITTRPAPATAISVSTERARVRSSPARCVQTMRPAATRIERIARPPAYHSSCPCTQPTTLEDSLRCIASGRNPATSADAEESRNTARMMTPMRPMCASPSPWRRRLLIITPAMMSDMTARPAATHVT